jgi:hypothetical protein
MCMKRKRLSIRKPLFLLAATSFVAFLGVIALVYYFGSSGTYPLREILVPPETIEKSSWADQSPKERFIPNCIEFIRPSKEGGERFAVTAHAYRAFYKLVYSERSLPVITDTMVNQFTIATPSTLTVYVFSEKKRESAERGKFLQQVQFIHGGELFRVQLRPHPSIESPEERWIYFRYPGIYEQVVTLFTSSEEY